MALENDRTCLTIFDDNDHNMMMIIMMKMMMMLMMKTIYIDGAGKQSNLSDKKIS